MKKWRRKIDRWTVDIPQFIAATSVILLVIVVFKEVVFRYFFDAPSISNQELAWHLFSVSFLFAIPATFARDENVRVDILYQRWSPGVRAKIDVIGRLFFLAPTAVVLIATSSFFVIQSWSVPATQPLDTWTRDWPQLQFLEALLRQWILVGEISPDPGGLEGRWLIRAAVPLSFTGLLIQACLRRQP